jgi:probable rRNA maturation factor
MKVLISNEQNVWQLNKNEIAQLAEKIMREEKLSENIELSLVFCDDAAIKDLNKQFRNKDEATDVLAFPLPQSSFKEFTPMSVLIGDVVISVETAIRQAKEMEHELKKEVTLLLIHGLLHLVGYDHIKSEDKKKMLEREKELCDLLFPKTENKQETKGTTLIGRGSKVLIRKKGGMLV